MPFSDENGLATSTGKITMKKNQIDEANINNTGVICTPLRSLYSQVFLEPRGNRVCKLLMIKAPCISPTDKIITHTNAILELTRQSLGENPKS